MTLEHVSSLRVLLAKHDKEEGELFLCVEDLVANGVSLPRFAENEPVPNRQDVTHFLVTWFLQIGLPIDSCREWMLEYSVEVLEPISSSSPSAIRHSTRSNVKYIYGSEVAMSCHCEDNPFRAPCNEACPVLPLMKERYLALREAKQESELKAQEREREAIEEVQKHPPKVGVKEKHRPQFLKAMALARKLEEESWSKYDILYRLKKEGFKTRTGKEWSYKTLDNELRAIGRGEEP